MPQSPFPGRPWVLKMTWQDLCFLHWQVDPALIAQTLPSGVEPHTRDGGAWLGAVPFRMTGTSPRFVPDVPGLSAFPELNLRTYVTVDGVPGVWFYSLDAAQPLAVRLARRFFHLPYFDARMWVHREGDVTRYASLRAHRGQPPARFAAAYRPVGPALTPAPDSLDAWLTDRHALYSADARGRVYRGRVDHAAWPLRRAQAEVAENTLADALGITLEGEPHLLHAESLEVRAWWLERVR
ncbi:DUF2071 domain-containing protein [Deinococcus sp. MIMF12]|uniref:DUF2071 domain-containing protein n=1 Tax=Deinococcus rhizophilus TaxID=3049544 RepID=A0ABT7JL61_9DEIO|nr:DUF2071 domain-containing protein [Deinococcus rhizophilus]MDL2345787.1 DUF2071 domain-containing protein [Deinococcus rhizophilus]